MRAQFAKNLERLGVCKGDRVTVAFSGGRDSVVLLCLLRELFPKVEAVHVHHGLRGEAADRDACFCKEFCESRKIPCTILKGDARAYGEARGMSLEEGARAMRYALLEPFMKEGFLATAHHADDAAETFFINLYRGSGSAGLGGIPEKRGNLIRPLLPFSRAQIDEFIKEEGLDFCEDETNADEIYLRNFIRKEILPLLNGRSEGNFTKGLHASMEYLRQEQKALDQWAAMVQSDEREVLQKLPEAVLKRVLDRMNGEILDRIHFDLIFQLLMSDARHGQVQIRKNRYFRMEYGRCRFFSEQESLQVEIKPGETVVTDGWSFSIRPWEINKPFTHFALNCDRIKGNLVFRHRKEGDRFSPKGRGGTSRLQKRLKNDRIPRSHRDSLWVLTDSKDTVLWVEGYGADAQYACGSDTKHAFCIEIKKEGK